ncbi:MAG: hypothetical protein H7A34_04700 [bacterium]|nr:hypothetical protein [bacterium]
MLGLLPVSGIIPLKFPFAERYIYIPSLGLSFICAGYFAYVFCIYRNVPEKTHRIPRIGCLALFSLLIVLSIDRTADWKTDFSLWKATYKTTPNSPVVLYSLGKIFQDTNRLNKAEKAYRRAIALNEAYLAPYMNLAVIYIDEKRFGNALSVNAEILKRDPYCAIAHFNNAIIYKELNKKEMELSSYTKAIESDPHFTPAYSALASYYMKQNDSAKALETLSSGINKNHSWIEGYKQFYSYAVKSGNRSAFEAVIKQGIQSNPSSKELRLLYLKFNAEN